MKRTPLILTFIGIWLAISLGAKAQRYFVQVEPVETRAFKAVMKNVGLQNWHTSPSPVSDNGALTLHELTRPECDLPVRLAFIGFGDATDNLLDDALGASPLFYYAGELSPALPRDEQRRHIVKTFGLGQFGGSRSADMPIIAVSRSPEGPQCQPDILHHWPQIEQDFRK